VSLSPIVQNWVKKPKDSFPLSYYPMFSARRDASYVAQTLVGVDGAGKRVILPYQWAGHGGFNEVRRQLRATVRKPEKAARLCEKLAQRAAKSKRHRGLAQVEILTVKHDIKAFFQGDRRPLEQDLHVACPVPVLARLESKQQEVSQ
jgi:hypothetical protein